ncbi:MAG: dihydropteroate synthase [Planctomycetes bacterium]|nr:dihydropteroate synthase [Planctomycetota bacterium]
MARMVLVFGIVNVTDDSFSDGGRFRTAEAALAHGRRLWAEGAQVLDLGAESTHPDAADVPAAEEVRRLAPVVEALVAEGVPVSIDTCKPEVMRAFAGAGIAWLNDVHGFRSDAALAAAAAAPAAVRFVVMHSRSRAGRADRPVDPEDGATLVRELAAFVAERLAAFAAVGIARERLVFDPGMGFFLGRTAAPSLAVLRRLPELVALGVPWLVSVSRKSVVGEVTGRAVAARGPGTLAAELWAARAGAACLRTHDVAALRDGLLVERAIAGAS